MDVKGFKVTLYTNKGQTEEVVKGLKMEVGRNVAADLPIMANGVSRSHLNVAYKDGAIQVTDLASTNGTYIAGSRLQANKPISYEPGKRISLGQAGCFLRIEMLGEIEETTDSKIKQAKKSEEVETVEPKTTVAPPPTDKVSSVVFSEEEKEDFKEHTRSVIREEILAEAKLEAKKEIQSEIEKTRKKQELVAQQRKKENTNGNGTNPGAKPGSQLTQDTGIFNVFANAVSNIAGPVDSDHKAKKKAHKYIQNAEKLVQQRKKEAEAAIRNGLGRARAQAKDIVEQAKKKSLEINDLNNKKLEDAQNEAANLKREAQKYVEKVKIENAKLEERLNFLKKDISEYQSNYSAKEETLKKLKTKITELQDEHDKKVKQLNSLAENVDKDLKDKQRELERLTKKQSEEVEDHQAKLSNFERKYDEFNRIYKNELEAFEKIKIERTESENQIKSYHNEFLELEKQSHAKKIAFKKIQDKLERAVEKYETDSAKMESDLQKTQGEIDQDIKDKLELAQKEANEIMANTQSEADRIRAEVSQEVEALRKSVKAESEEILRSSKEKSDHLVNRSQKDYDELLGSAKSQSEEMLTSAREQSEEMLSSSRSKSEELLNSAKSQSDEMLTSARSQSEELLNSTNQESNEILSRAKEKENSIDSIIETKLAEVSQKEQAALAEAQEKLEEANSIFQRETEKANKEVDFLLSTAKREKDELISSAQSTKEELISSAEKTKEELVSGAEQEKDAILTAAAEEKENILSDLQKREKEQIEYFENERAKFHSEIEQMRSTEKSSLESELAELKVGQLRKIDIEVEKKKSLEQEFRVEQADVWAKSIGISLQTSLVKKFEFVAEDPVLIRDEIERISKSILIGEVPDEQEEIRKLMNFDPARIKRVKKYWRNAAISGVVGIIALIMSPYVVKTVKTNVKEIAKNKKEASAEYVKNVEEKRKEERRFTPEKVNEYKSTYTDRVLYTEGYVKNEMKKSYREEWSLNLDTFFVETLRLSDNAIFSFISKESILIEDLKKARESINAQRKEEGIQKMRNLEQAFEKDVKKLLKTEGKYMMFTDFKKDYYKKQFKSGRVPANKK